MMFKNEQNITRIVFNPIKTHNFCPLGKLYCQEIAKEGEKPLLAHYTNNFTIRMEPHELMCDYCDVENWLRKNICDKELIIEDCVSLLFNYLLETYRPKHLVVESFVNDAVHGPVTVFKEL